MDDDAALDATEESTLNAENVALQQLEEEKEKEAIARAQAEQQRLVELQRIEDEVNAQKDEERRQRAKNATEQEYFFLSGVKINEIVFDVAEHEDLELFPEIVETLVDVEGEVEGEVEVEGGEADGPAVVVASTTAMFVAQAEAAK